VRFLVDIINISKLYKDIGNISKLRKFNVPQKKTRKKAVSRAKKKPQNQLDKQTVQKAAASALLSLAPSAMATMCKGLDPDLGYELVYAAANQTLKHFEGVAHTGGIRPPTKMSVAVKHDPSLTQTEIQYSFTESKFTILTPDDLNAPVSTGDRKVTKEESLRNNLSESLPSAQLKLFYNQGLLLANGDEEAYRNKYLPNQFKITSESKTKSRKSRKSKKRKT